MGKSTLKKLIKKTIRAEVLRYFIEKKTGRNGKGREITYLKLDMQEYLTEQWDDIKNLEKNAF